MKIEKFRKHLQMLHLNVYNTILHLLSQIALWETPKLRDAAAAAAAAAESLQSCLTLCNPIDSSPPDSAIPGIFQARILEWAAISFSNAWKWKVKVKSLSRVQLLVTPQTAPYQAPVSMGFSRQEYWSGLPLPFILILLVLLFYFSSLSRRFFQLYQLTSLLYFFCYHITWIFLFHGFSFMHSFSLRRYLVFKKVS